MRIKNYYFSLKVLFFTQAIYELKDFNLQFALCHFKFLSIMQNSNFVIYVCDICMLNQLN